MTQQRLRQHLIDMAALFYSPVDCTDASDMHHSNASLMHRWINRWIKQRSLCKQSKPVAPHNDLIRAAGSRQYGPLDQGCS